MFVKRNFYGNQLDENIKKTKGGENMLPWIFCVFTEKSSENKLKAAKYLAETLSSKTSGELMRAELSMRETTSAEWLIDRKKYKIEDFLTKKMSYEEKRAVAVFSSFSPNGYIRERALKVLVNFDRVLPFIMLRLNDWVKEVREAAVAAFKSRMAKADERELLISLPFAEKLGRGKRQSNSEELKKFVDTLVKPENESVLLEGLKSDNYKTRKMCVKIITDERRFKVELALKRMKEEKNPFLRKLLFSRLAQNANDFEEKARSFLNDKYPVIRLEALKYFFENNKSDALKIAEKSLLDKSALVRAAAQRYVREKNKDFEFVGFYQKNLNKNTAAAVAGMGETGGKEDAEKIEKYLSDERTAVVKAAMTALMRLDNKNYAQAITEFLLDYRNGVVKTARNLIIKNSPDFKRVKEIFDSAVTEYNKFKCLEVLFNAAKWDSLIYMLQAVYDKNPKIKDKAIFFIERWLDEFNYSFVTPNERQRDDIMKLIEGSGEELNEKTKQEIRFVI